MPKQNTHLEKPSTKAVKNQKLVKPGMQTPLMEQYNSIKAKYPDAILLFRMGDFYETFGEDAKTTSHVLGIVLTKRANGAAADIELAGFPHHSLDVHLPKLVRAGYRVAICDQLEDPKLTKKIVKRGVTEVVTPGVAHSDKLLDHTNNNFLASIYFAEDVLGISFLDISTGEFLLAEGDQLYIDKLLHTFKPSEVIYSKNHRQTFKKAFGDHLYTYPIDDWVYSFDYAKDILLNHFETRSLKGFGVQDLKAGIIAAGGAMHYLGETEHPNIQHITSLSRIDREGHVWLDKFTVRNLELLSVPGDEGASLIDVLDSTLSPPGARLMKRWVLLPLKEKQLIDDRLDTVSFFLKSNSLADGLRNSIKQIGDLERLIAKVPLGKINPRELVHLKNALEAVEQIKNACSKSKNLQLNKISEQLNSCNIIRKRIEKEIQPDPPVQLHKGDVIAQGISKELDELRSIIHSGKDYIIQIQEREVKKTGISSLKVGFNNVFGYYLEVTHLHKEKVPEEWIRKQTLVNAERYITEELKEYEEKIVGAEDKILGLEKDLFNGLVTELHEYIQSIQLNSQLVAKLDCLLAFADNAKRYNYKRPEISNELSLKINEGRHPVIEQQLPAEESYVPNDVFLDNTTDQLLIITGPNMSGKSALLRQTALIVLMAQIGSYVPAKRAKIGIIDKIFTRVGAADNISSGESTFMVEMNETASIINNISERSLLLLDEIGRGTSTYDGISLAWALADYLHDHAGVQPKTLFATHYHELNELANHLERVKNFNVSVKEIGNKVIFLRKLVSGGSEHSFGIHVARMAGIPKQIIEKAKEILLSLEAERGSGDLAQLLNKKAEQSYQMQLFQLDDPVLAKIRDNLNDLDVDTLTPVEALLKLNEIKALAASSKTEKK